MMKRRTIRRKSLLRSHSQPTLNKLMAIEEVIITSHINEISHEETIAITKIKEDPGSLSPNRKLDHYILIMVD